MNEQDTLGLSEIKANLGELKDKPGELTKFVKETILSLSAQEVIIPGTYDRKIVEELIKNCKSEHEVIAIYSDVYTHIHEYQLENKRLHKGPFLVFLANIYWNLGYKYLSKRYLMLTLIEDAILTEGRVETTGSYPRLSRWFGLTDTEINNYASQAYKIFKKNRENARFSEWILQELDKKWLIEIPSAEESTLYKVNKVYVTLLLNNLSNWRELERLAEYLLSCIPGLKTERNKRTPATEYDIVCSVQGLNVDFRSELGRYFICECKNWNRKVDTSSIAKFSHVLDSVKAKFGIIFSKEGISGQGKTEDAERMQLIAFQNRGIVIISIDHTDLEYVANGGNFISLLREKYERVRLDIPKPKNKRVKNPPKKNTSRVERSEPSGAYSRSPEQDPEPKL